MPKWRYGRQRVEVRSPDGLVEVIRTAIHAGEQWSEPAPEETFQDLGL